MVCGYTETASGVAPTVAMGRRGSPARPLRPGPPVGDVVDGRLPVCPAWVLPYSPDAVGGAAERIVGITCGHKGGVFRALAVLGTSRLMGPAHSPGGNCSFVGVTTRLPSLGLVYLPSN